MRAGRSGGCSREGGEGREYYKEYGLVLCCGVSAAAAASSQSFCLAVLACEAGSGCGWQLAAISGSKCGVVLLLLPSCSCELSLLMGYTYMYYVLLATPIN